METLLYKIGGMSCASCSSSIENEVNKIKGVSSSSVNYAVGSGQFVVDSESLRASVENKINTLGYTILSENSLIESNDSTGDDNFIKFVISIVLSLFIFALAMWPLNKWPNKEINWFLQLLLCAPIWIWIGLKFQRSLFSFIRSGKSNMNTLIGLGTSSAFLYSGFITIFNSLSLELGLTQKVYFEAVGFIISFVFLGQYFEEKAKKKTTEAMNSLFKMNSKSAFVLLGDEVNEIDIEEVKKGDLLRVKPGEKLPVDGKIVKGFSAIDESMISGEPIPVSKTIGDNVFAGTINGDSVIDYQATKVGADTFLSQIISFVEQAQNSKPEIQKYTDRISSYFIPVVIIISLITFLAWYFLGPLPIWGNAISNFIAVLVIACPCALGLATPTAVVVSTGRASLKGILIGGGEVIEKSVGIDTVIFDKTGTITEGRPSVIEVKQLDDSINLLQEVASIEQFSEHPISKAILNYALSKEVVLSEPDEFTVIKGKGIEAVLRGHEILIGNELLLRENGVSINDLLRPEQVGSYVFVSKDGEHIGTYVVGDQIKESSRGVIKRFKEKGIQTWMITGDNEVVAEEVCKELGIENFVANALPLAKSEKIEVLQKSGRRVAMVGDGVNDAPALAKADLSIAMGTGTDVAINASDVTIVKGELSKALEFIELSEGTMKIIKQNLFLSMLYNTALIPVAAGVLVIFGGPMMPPILASVAMGLSSISVVSNSLRIRKLV